MSFLFISTPIDRIKVGCNYVLLIRLRQDVLRPKYIFTNIAFYFSIGRMRNNLIGSQYFILYFEVHAYSVFTPL